MKICVVGAGAVGGLMAAKLSLAGEEVTVVDRGVHLAAIREKGLKLIWEDGTTLVAKDLETVERLEDAGAQDLVILALKAHFLDQVARKFSSLVGPETAVLTVQNGIPWWYFHKLGGPHDGRRLESLDPGGVLEKHIDSARIVGCVVYPAAGVPQPGVIQHVEGDRFPIGELDGRLTERAETIKGVLERAGFRSRILDDIRSEIWLKAWGNLSFNPISALTHATLADICRFPETRALAVAMMQESQAIAEELGVTFRHTIEKRVAGAESVGAHKTSMLQDVELGRSLEVEALMGSVLELGRITGVSAPSIEAVYACVKLLNKTMLLQNAGVRMSDVA